MRIAIIGGGIAGLAAARRLAETTPDAEITLVESDQRLGGKLLTEQTPEGFLIEGGADSFLSRKERGVGLCKELGVDLIGRRPEHARSFVRRGSQLLPLPEGLTGTIPTNLEALEQSPLLSTEGKVRLAAEVEVPVATDTGDESVAAFVSRRLGREAYESLVQPLMTGIYGGDGERLSLQATFPQLRAVELEHGSLLRGLEAQPAASPPSPPFLTPVAGMGAIVERLVRSLEGRVRFALGTAVGNLREHAGRYVVELWDDSRLECDGVVLAVPAYVAGPLLDGLDADWLGEEHYDIPYESSASVTVAYDESQVPHPLDGYGYLVPSNEGSDVLACTWSSSKWEGRAPAGKVLIRVFIGRSGRDVTGDSDRKLLRCARGELRILGIEGAPILTRIHRWRGGMPQYVVGHLERIGIIESALAEHPGLALAGAAYRGVGVPDCIHSGEQAADSVVEALVGTRG